MRQGSTGTSSLLEKAALMQVMNNARMGPHYGVRRRLSISHQR